jgi:hypothetical protein
MMTNRRLFWLLVAASIGFMALALVFGEMLHVYDKVWWWDDMLHALSGILFAYVGLYVLHLLERKNAVKLHPATVLLFTFCFTITAGVVWEIYEFVLDIVLGFTMQQWNMGPHAIVMGKSYQGMGLRDTMQDLILATVGAFMTSVGICVNARRVKSVHANDR